MRFSFGCPVGWHVEAGGLFSRLTITEALWWTKDHTEKCPYCNFKIDVLTHREGFR